MSAILWTFLGLQFTTECSLILIFTYFNFLKLKSFSIIVFFIQIVFCKLNNVFPYRAPVLYYQMINKRVVILLNFNYFLRCHVVLSFVSPYFML